MKMAEKDEDYIEKISILDIFLPIIVKCVNGAELVPYMTDILSDGERKKIRQKARSESTSEATKHLIDIIKIGPDEKRKLRSFINALQQAEYPFVSQILQGDTAYKLHHENQAKIIDCLAPDVGKRLVPKEIAPHLLSKGIISHQDEQEISAEESNYGPFAGALILLDKITRRVDNWYELFLEVLIEFENDGYRELARLIDSDFVEKKELQMRALNGETTNSTEDRNTPEKQDASKTKELKGEIVESLPNTMNNSLSVFGSALSADNDLNLPSSDNKEDKMFGMALNIEEIQSVSTEDTELKQYDLQEKDHRTDQVDELSGISERVDDVSIQTNYVSNNQTDVEIDDLKDNPTFVKIDGVTNQQNKAKPKGVMDQNTIVKIYDITDQQTSENHDDITEQETKVKTYDVTDQQTRVKTVDVTDKQTNEKFHAKDDVNYDVTCKEDIKDKEILENALYMENIEEKLKYTYELALNPNTTFELNLTEDEGTMDDNLDEVQSIEDNEITKENFILRGYQKELADPGINGLNTIVIAPTGSGKTHVAMEIIQNHFKKFKDNTKVVLIVNNSTLARQHFGEVQKYLDFSVQCITGDTEEKVKSLATWIERRDILIVTAQIWLNSLLRKDTTINAFTLVIFDECHHCAQKHPYNKIMEFYMDVKYQTNTRDITLPQILGLTASLDIGKSKDEETAKEKIIKLMSNLDVCVVSTVRSDNGRRELYDYVNIPFEDTVTVPERDKNYFGQLIEKQMEFLENKIKFCDYATYIEDKISKEKIMKIPVQRGGELYTQWIGETFQIISVIADKQAQQFYKTCRKYLDILNRALIIYKDARTCDAYEFICQSVEEIPTEKQHEIDSKMIKWVAEIKKPEFKSRLTEDNNENPKLKELERVVCDVYDRDNDMRAIVFVKTKDLGIAIVDWMKDTDKLKQLNPVTFFGAQASFEKGGLTKNEQSDVLTQFRDGHIKLIVATTIAEEGLDIAKCNLVIRYEHVTNVIGMVQSRGRARAIESSFVIIGGHKIAERQEMNILAENIMQTAIYELQDYIENNKAEFKERLMTLQKYSKIDRENEASEKKKKAKKMFCLQCGNCSQFLCKSGDIKKIAQSHHAVISHSILEYVEIKPNQLPGYKDSNIRCGVGKILCKECNNAVGNISVWKSVPFPVLHAKSLRIQDEEGIYNKVPKQWKDAPFPVEELDMKDHKKLLLAYKHLYKK